MMVKRTNFMIGLFNENEMNIDEFHREFQSIEEVFWRFLHDSYMQLGSCWKDVATHRVLEDSQISSGDIDKKVFFFILGFSVKYANISKVLLKTYEHPLFAKLAVENIISSILLFFLLEQIYF